MRINEVWFEELYVNLEAFNRGRAWCPALGCVLGNVSDIRCCKVIDVQQGALLNDVERHLQKHLNIFQHGAVQSLHVLADGSCKVVEMFGTKVILFFF